MKAANGGTELERLRGGCPARPYTGPSNQLSTILGFLSLGSVQRSRTDPNAAVSEVLFLPDFFCPFDATDSAPGRSLATWTLSLITHVRRVNQSLPMGLKRFGTPTRIRAVSTFS